MACKDFADSSSAGLAFGKQVDCDAPQTQLKEMRFTSSDLQFSAESTQSEEIRSDRNVTDLVRTATSVGGTIGYELSYGDIDVFMQAALSSADSLDGNGATIKNGVAKHYFTFEDSVGASGSTYYNQFFDCEIDTMSFNISQGEILNGDMAVLGRSSSTSETSADSDGYEPADDNPVYNAVSMVSAIEVDDAEIGEVQSIVVNIANNKREQRAIGKEGLAGVGDGQFIVSGTMTIYFADNSLYEKFLADEAFKFYVMLDDKGDGTGNKIAITLPKVKFGNISRAISGNNQDVLLEADYQAIYDAGEQATIMIATTDAV